MRDKFDLAKENYLNSLFSVKSIIDDGDIFGDLLLSTTADQIEDQSQTNNERAILKDSKKVFIVHGHDHSLKIELEVFLSHIGLTPIVLHREVDGGQTVIEKFESNSDVSYAFILLTPDEIAYTVDQDDVKNVDRIKKKS